MTDFSPGRGLTVITALMLVILIVLGTWQALKVGPKTDLVDRIEAGMAAEAVAMPGVDVDPALFEYRHVNFRGALLSRQSAAIFGTNLDGEGGYHHYGAIKTVSGQAVIVNFGWSSDSVAALPVKVGDVRNFSGVLRMGAKPGPFTPVNDIQAGTFFLADIGDLTKAFGLSMDEVYSYRIMLDQIAPDGQAPLGGQVRVEIKNDHFKYALTWYGIALALIGVFLAVGFSITTVKD